MVGLMKDTEEEGRDQSSCQARCEAGGNARNNMKYCTPIHRAWHLNKTTDTKEMFLILLLSFCTS